jgi:radical SAM/Cys-rich protein
MEAAGAPDFDGRLRVHGLALRRGPVTTLQVNVGLRCDLACHHCHVEAGPKRREALGERLAERVLEVIGASPALELLDLTGGAPELNPHFRLLVAGARRLGRRVIDRCNLTVLTRPGQEDTADFLAAQGAEIVASLPCYGPENVKRQRGRGVFARSVEALRRLNALGYGRPGSPLVLDLVYNPVGDALPPAQAELEARYRTQLGERFGIEFHRLYTLTNMPIRRFARALAREGRHDAYLALLVHHFNPATVPALMCRSLVSVDYRGRLYDCDFHQALDFRPPGPASLFDVDDLAALAGNAITTAPHCFGCTAGPGSSCTGSLVVELGT